MVGGVSRQAGGARAGELRDQLLRPRRGLAPLRVGAHSASTRSTRREYAFHSDGRVYAASAPAISALRFSPGRTIATSGTSRRLGSAEVAFASTSSARSGFEVTMRAPAQ